MEYRRSSSIYELQKKRKNFCLGSLCKGISKRCFSIRNCFGCFTFLSHVIFGFCITVSLIVFSNYYVYILSISKTSTIMDYSRTRNELYLHQSGQAVQSILDYLWVHEEEFGDLSFFDNTTEGYERNIKIVRYILNVVRQSQDTLSCGLLLFNGMVLGAQTWDESMDIMLKRNFTESYNSSEGLVGNLYVCFVGYEPFVSNYPLFGDWFVALEGFDPQRDDQESWYLPNVDYSDFVWSNYFSVDGLVTTSATKEYRDRSGELRGVVANAFSLENFNAFLRSVDLPYGEIFFVDQGDGLLLASSNDETTFSVDQEGAKYRVLPQDSSNDVIRETTKNLLKNYENVSYIGEIESRVFVDSSGVLRIASCTSTDVLNFRLLIVYVVKYSDVFLFNIVGNVIALVVSVILVVLFSVCSNFLIVIMMCPLNLLIRDLKKVEKLEFDSIGIPKILMWEVRSVYEQFRVMLNQYKSFIPISIKRPSVTNLKSLSFNSDGSRSSDGGSRSSRSSGSAELSVFEYNKFMIGMSQHNGILVKIVFCVSSLLKNADQGLDIFINFHQKFCEFLLNRMDGIVMKMEAREVVLTYDIPMHCFDQVERLTKWLNECTRKFSGLKLKFWILIDRKNYLKGVIGCTTAKSPTLILPDLLYLCMRKYHSNVILLSRNALKCMKQGRLFLPIDIIKNSRRKKQVEVIYRYLDKVDTGDDEWMYELRQKQTKEIYSLDCDGVTALLRGNYEEAYECFSRSHEHLKSDTSNDSKENEKSFARNFDRSQAELLFTLKMVRVTKILAKDLKDQSFQSFVNIDEIEEFQSVLGSIDIICDF